MAQKIILTEHQHTLIVNEIINEMLKDVDESTLLNEEPIDEGLWTNIKYGLSKLGRYKAGGKIFGKGKVDQEAAAKIQAIVDKKGNEMIKALDAKIKEENPKFPNNKEPQQFLNTILSISAVYDSVIAATQKDPKDEAYMPIDVANGIINDLREYVKKFLDVDLAAVYSTVDEAEGNVVELSEEELRELDEAFGITEDYFDAVTEVEINEVEINEEDINEDEASDVRKQLKAKRGGGEDFGSERMKTLKSNKLPLLLAGIGGSLGGLSWLAKTEWFKNWLEGLLGADQTVTTPDIVKDVTGGPADDKGMLHWMSKINQGEGLPPVKTGADVQAFVDKFGADNVKHMFDGNGGGPSDTQIQQLQQLVGGDNASKPVGELFNPSNDTFGSMKGGQNLFGVSKAATFLGQIVLKQGQKLLVKGAGTALAAKFAGLASVLGPIGVGLIAGGALVKLMRMKGQKQSRAATLNALYQSIRNIEGGAGIIKPEGETVDVGSAQDPSAIDTQNKEGGDKGAGGTGKSGGSNDDLYNSLRNLFKFMVNNRKMLGTRSADNVGTGGATAGSANAGGGAGAASTAETFKKGDKATYKGRNVTVTVPDVSPGYTQVDADGDGPEKKTYAVKTTDLKKQLSEGKFFNDKRLVQFLQKSLSFDKLKSFEDFMGRVEIIRNKVKKLNAGDDKAIKNFMEQFNSNPIMATDFTQLFAIDSSNPAAVNALKAFIDDIFVTVYSGKFKYGNMIDKMAELGGNINKLEEADKGYNAVAPNKAFVKDAQDRGRFKRNLVNFIVTAISLFQYLHKQKTENNKNQFKGGNKSSDKSKDSTKGSTDSGTVGGDSSSSGGATGGGTTGSGDSGSGTSSSGGGADSDSDTGGGSSSSSRPFKPATYESADNQNPSLNEELKRIKNIMGQVI